MTAGPTLRQLAALALARAFLPVLYPGSRIDAYIGPRGRIRIDSRPR